MRVVVGVLLIIAGFVISAYALWHYINYWTDGEPEDEDFE